MTGKKSNKTGHAGRVINLKHWNILRYYTERDAGLLLVIVTCFPDSLLIFGVYVCAYDWRHSRFVCHFTAIFLLPACSSGNRLELAPSTGPLLIAFRRFLCVCSFVDWLVLFNWLNVFHVSMNRLIMLLHVNVKVISINVR